MHIHICFNKDNLDTQRVKKILHALYTHYNVTSPEFRWSYAIRSFRLPKRNVIKMSGLNSDDLLSFEIEDALPAVPDTLTTIEYLDALDTKADCIWQCLQTVEADCIYVIR